MKASARKTKIPVIKNMIVATTWAFEKVGHKPDVSVILFIKRFCRYGFLIFSFVLPQAVAAQKVVIAGGKATLTSPAVTLVFDLKKGRYDVTDNRTRQTVVKEAHFAADNWRSDAEGALYTTRTYAVSEFGKTGKALEVTAGLPGKGTLTWTARAYTGQPYVVMGMKVFNASADTMQLKKWGPLLGGTLYGDLKKLNAKMLDGNGGGEATKVQDAGYMQCRNNLLLTFDQENGQRTSFVAGGIRYADFEKHVLLETDQIRKGLIRKRDAAAGLNLISYIDLGEESYDFDADGTGLIVSRAWPYAFTTAQVKELGTTVYADKKIIISAKNLDTSKKYSLGFSWMEEGDGRIQSVSVDNGEGTTKYPLLSRRYLPESSKGKNPEELLFQLPKKVVAPGGCRILIEVDKGPNAVLSEVWLEEGWALENPVRYEIPYQAPSYFAASIYAQDPVGKRIDPGRSYTAKDDLFYLDVATSDPFKSLETYGLALKQFQQVNNLALYTFPSVCLWYASHRNYGGGPSVNDSPGAVDEMDRANASGFTKYATVAVRLVPDNYEINNEQGWWDDQHWQRYGSGSDNPNSVVVPGAHYKAPYETTKKWAGAILKKGGIPLTYFQTARRSQDFCDSFPQYMLFNESNHTIPDSNWLTLGKSSYDFTDPNFIAHMKAVYKNLREGGVRGLMFDYTSTAWADFGGMEDKYATAAAMYRNVFKLAYEGLGGKNWIHERNLERGTDLTLGMVASQRVWGDTDGITDEMVSRTGLRWYKNRVVVSYDMDSKNTEKLRLKSRDYLRQMLTMAYVASGRLLLGNSFAKMTKDDLYDLSRVFPFHTAPQSARPIDLFLKVWPTVYDFKVNEQWHLVTLYNTGNETPMKLDVPLSRPNYEGGLQLNSSKQYYAYDFWNEKFIGKLSGNTTLQQELRNAEARMIAVHEVEDHPQFISTNRHIMQGYEDLKKLNWSKVGKIYSGTAAIIGGEAYKVIIATNGFTPLSCKTASGTCSWVYWDKAAGLIELTISNDTNKDIAWTVTFK